MSENNVKEFIEGSVIKEYLKLSDIPNIDLYMDQVTTFIEDNLSEYRRNESDKILTKTMINNYAKDKLLPPPIKKKYSRNHISLLILIYHMKSILPIGDIKTLLDRFTDIDGSSASNKSIAPLYDIFYKMHERISEQVSADAISEYAEIEALLESDNVDSALASQSGEPSTVLFATVLSLILKADAQKRLAQKIIDEYFKKDIKA